MPYELLNKKFRAAQKSLDRDIASVTSSSRELTAQMERSGEVAAEEVVKTLDVMSQKLASLKRRVRGGVWRWCSRFHWYHHWSSIDDCIVRVRVFRQLFFGDCLSVSVRSPDTLRIVQ